MRVDQLIPSFAPHDAIGNHTLQVRRLLRQAGIDSDIYAEHAIATMGRESRPWRDCPRSVPGGAYLYQASTHSGMAAWLIERARAGQRVLSNYHNITPPSYYDRWLPEAAEGMVDARDQLEAMGPHVELAVAVSRFNEAELQAVGYGHTAVCPALVDLERYHDRPDRRTFDRLRRRRDAGGPQWLFVGRVAPNKCQHDVIAAFAVYRKLFEPDARLTLVGGINAPRYFRALQMQMADLGLGDSVEVIDGLSHTELLAHFLVADVFVCLSEHEGFCVPLLESMELGLPTVAFASSAIPETLADAGLLLADKDPLAVACSVDGLLADDERRQATVAAGRERAGELSLERTAKQFLDIVTAQLDSAR